MVKIFPNNFYIFIFRSQTNAIKLGVYGDPLKPFYFLKKILETLYYLNVLTSKEIIIKRNNNNNCLSTAWDQSTGRVGRPIPCCRIKLVSWEEGIYILFMAMIHSSVVMVVLYNIVDKHY